MKKNTILLFSLSALLPLLLMGQVTFTSSSKILSGTDQGLVDLNGDFLDDFIAITTTNIQIQYQNPDGSFTTVDRSISAPYSLGWSLAVGDYDANGYNDLVWGSTAGANVFKANDSGTGYSLAAETNTVFTQRTNFVDINNDGELDIFICDDIEPNEYYINEGNGVLTRYDGADANGIVEGLGVYFEGGNYGSMWVDFDNDRDNDLFIAKCGATVGKRINELHRNNSETTANSFTEIGALANLDFEDNTWSSAWGDYDNDGDMDCFIGSSVSDETHKLMRNDNGVFVDVSVTSNVSSASERGFENVFIDFDNDGWIDIYAGGEIHFNNGDGTFTINNPNLSNFGGAFGDANNDGFIDMWRNSVLYTNDGNSNNWIKIATVGTDSNINGIGARLEIVTDQGGTNEMTQIRDVRSGEGFEYMNSLNVHFGIGSETSIDQLTVYWPSGTVDVFLNPTINDLLVITEGETLSLEDTLVSDLILYPNPTKALLNLSTQYNFTEPVYSVFDITGRRVINGKLNSNTIDVSSLSNGNYILRVMDGGKIKTQKFIKY